ncbi:hypothetical protein BJV82DRAFT_674480 [Fennellomyces sp. T-0311]|nr:hypothetical protein BJV82DRAFT_674480 [Fennellomyces sp. T-0311]
MTDKFCFALLRTTTLQILQSAGFDSAHIDPTNILTDVMSQYVQLLASTTSSYAQLAGRSTGNIWDVIDGLNELGMSPESLKEWLELEGKALAPPWSAQSDPGRTLEGVVRNGRSSHEDALVYEYKDIPSDEEFKDDDYDADDVYSLESEEEEEEEDIPNKEEDKGLPDYIPSYMPRFPSTVKEDATPPPRALPQVMPSISRQPSPGAPAAPIIVRHRKKPVDNPFTHVVPFEESALAMDKATTLALSLHENEENKEEEQQQQQQQVQPPATKRRRVALSSLPMKKAMGSLASKDQQHRRKQQREALAGNYAMFRKFTQDDAAPGNTMFGNSSGVLVELLRRVAPPAMVSKLSSPNLLVDVATTTPSSAAPIATGSNGTSSTAQQDPITVKSSGSSSNNSNAGASASSSSTSMLATLAGGQYSRKHTEEIFPASASSTTHTTLPFSSTASSLAAAAAVALPTTSSTPPTQNIPSTTTPRTNLTPISLASLSAGGKGSNNMGEKKKLPKLTLNLTNGGESSTPSTAENTPSSATSVNTPKIRFKIKPPEPAQEKINVISTDDAQDKEIVHCICSNPTVDYGTFMISCDKCHVWYHGECVDIAESDEVETWYCVLGTVAVAYLAHKCPGRATLDEEGPGAVRVKEHPIIGTFLKGLLEADRMYDAQVEAPERLGMITM